MGCARNDLVFLFRIEFRQHERPEQTGQGVSTRIRETGKPWHIRDDPIFLVCIDRSLPGVFRLQLLFDLLCGGRKLGEDSVGQEILDVVNLRPSTSPKIVKGSNLSVSLACLI